MRRRHWLINFRRHLEYSAEELAKKIGVTRQCINYIESGYSTPLKKTREKLENILGFDWENYEKLGKR